MGFYHRDWGDQPGFGLRTSRVKTVQCQPGFGVLKPECFPIRETQMEHTFENMEVGLMKELTATMSAIVETLKRGG